MKKKELIELLSQLATEDLAEDCKLEDHPCSVAIRAIEQCFEDIDSLRGYIEGSGYEMPLLGEISFQPNPTTPYNPEW